MSSLEGKVVVVTGGAAGLGRACVRELGSRGASVAIGDVDQRRGEEAAAELGDAGLFRRCDVAVAADCERLAAAAIERFGRIDGLLVNAGIKGNGSVETCDEETWDRVLAVNLKGMFLIAKAVVPHLRAAGGGAILNMASVSGFWASRTPSPTTPRRAA